MEKTGSPQKFARIMDQNLIRHVDLIRPVGTKTDKVREGGHQQRKALGVGDVPVEDILLWVTHAVDKLKGKLDKKTVNKYCGYALPLGYQGWEWSFWQCQASLHGEESGESPQSKKRQEFKTGVEEVTDSETCTPVGRRNEEEAGSQMASWNRVSTPCLEEEMSWIGRG